MVSDDETGRAGRGLSLTLSKILPLSDLTGEVTGVGREKFTGDGVFGLPM